MNFRCEPCDMTFNGIIPYQAHQNSAKHLKKVQASGVTPSNTVNTNQILSNTVKLDKYIKPYNNEYKCILCNSILNSLQQAQAHVLGKKHRSLAPSIELSGIQNVPMYSSNKGSADTATTSTSENPVNSSSFSFLFHNINIDDVMKDVKIFDVDDPIRF